LGAEVDLDCAPITNGRKGAGKTSFLAALAMPHAARDGVACTWRCAAADVPRPDGAEDEWAAGDPAVAAFHGVEWLRAAVAAIDSGGVPRLNPNDHHPFRFRFDLKEDGIEYPIEVIDYSGELLAPEQSAGELAVRLRDHLAACDGLLVLAEAPPHGAVGNAVGELHRLQQAFAVLGGGERGRLPVDTSIALVVNKWDRRGPAADADHVTAFLDGPDGVAHRGLRDALRTADPTGFRAFAASAFGPTRPGNGTTEHPGAERPLPSFGLEEPFLWAARRRRTFDADAAVARVRSLAYSPWWRIDHLAASRRGTVARAVADIRAAYPPDFPHAAEVERIAADTSHAWRPQMVFLLLLVFLLWGTATGLADQARYARHRPVLAAGGSADPPAGEAARDWLESYTGRHLLWSPFSRLVISNSTAERELIALRDRIKEQRAGFAARERDQAE